MLLRKSRPNNALEPTGLSRWLEKLVGPADKVLKGGNKPGPPGGSSAPLCGIPACDARLLFAVLSLKESEHERHSHKVPILHTAIQYSPRCGIYDFGVFPGYKERSRNDGSEACFHADC